MYIVLLSNSPAPSFPNNTSADFTIPLNTPLHTPFKEKWRVSLFKIIIPNTFYNLEAEENIVLEYENGETSVFNVAEGVYPSPKKLIKHLFHTDFNISWKRKGFQLLMGDSVKRISISMYLSKILGFDRNIENNDKGKVLISSVTHFDPWINHRVLLIHSNLVRTSQVNDRQLHVLQSLVPDNHNNYHASTSRTYFPPDYLEVQGEYYTSLSFKITDIENNLIKFRGGGVILILSLVNGAVE